MKPHVQIRYVTADGHRRCSMCGGRDRTRIMEIGHEDVPAKRDRGVIVQPAEITRDAAFVICQPCRALIVDEIEEEDGKR
jgi:hypothetical protein